MDLTFKEFNHAITAGDFLASKPLRDIRPVDLQRTKQVISSRKYNGNFSTAVFKRGTVKFYTISNHFITESSTLRWVDDSAWKQALASIPDETILAGEIFIPNAAIEDLGAFQRWYTWHMNKLEGSTEAPPENATFRVFDTLCWNGHVATSFPYKERLALVPPALKVETDLFSNLQEAALATKKAEAMGIEGFVFWDACAPSKCKLEGKSRPRGAAWKVKPIFKTVFNLCGFSNPTPEQMVAILGNPIISFNCGSGLDQKQRQDLISLFQAGNKLSITVGHYGYDDLGRPELPVILNYSKQ